jgi:hypothetical protein
MKVDKEKMEIEIGAGIEATVEQFLSEFKKSVTTMSNAGMSVEQIKATLSKQVQESTGALGGLKKNLRNVTVTGINEAANQGMYAEYKNTGLSRWRWVTVSAKPCPDCAERHGQVETWEDWELMGLPKSGFSICQDHCHCKLVPENYQGKGLDSPIIRTLQSPKGQAYDSYKNTDLVDYISKARESIVTEKTLRQKTKDHPDFGGTEMSWKERVDWVRKNPDGVYFQIHSGKKQVVFVRDDYYVFSEDKKLKTAYTPESENIELYRYRRRYEWIKIPEGKWKMIK